MVGYSCGNCCSKPYPCDTCLGDTLRANGVSLDKIEEVRGLKKISNVYYDSWGFSELCDKLRKLVK